MTPPQNAEVRPAEPADAEPLLRVLCAAFGLDCDAARPLFYCDPFYDLSLKRVLSTPQDGIVACLTVIPSTLVLRGVAVPAAGIAGVATHPDHQRRGYASLLLTETVRALAQEGRFCVSALFPYSDEFYRRLGWETAARVCRWTGTLAPAAEDALADRVRAASLDSPSDLRWLQQFRDTLPPSEAGLCRRDARRWQVLAMTTQAWEWYIVGTPEGGGYAALQHPEESSGDPILIHEMAAASEDARRTLAAFLARASGGRTPLCWPTSPELPARYGLPPEPPCDALDPGMMLRPVDVAATLRALHPSVAPALARAGRSLTLSVSDAHCPVNTVSLRLAPQGIFADTTDAADHLRMEVGALAPLLTGDCLPSDLAAAGLLQPSSPQALALADAVFPRTSPFVAPADQF